MPHSYKEGASHFREDSEGDAEEVQKRRSIRSVATETNRQNDSQKVHREKKGWRVKGRMARLSTIHMVFNDSMEPATLRSCLASFIKLSAV